MRKPVIASIRGSAAGVGMSLVLASDLAIAAEDAVFVLAYCQIGTSPDGGSTYSLPRTVGLKRAFEFALLNDRLDANGARGAGLINRVVPGAALDQETEKLAARLARGPAHAYANTKELLNGSLVRNLNDQLDAEAVSFAECAATDDFAEGIAAFIEKRPPAIQVAAGLPSSSSRHFHRQEIPAHSPAGRGRDNGCHDDEISVRSVCSVFNLRGSRANSGV